MNEERRAQVNSGAAVIDPSPGDDDQSPNGKQGPLEMKDEITTSVSEAHRETATPPADEVNAVADSAPQPERVGQPKKKRHVFRYLLLLLVAASAMAGYWQRARLLKLLPGKYRGQVTSAQAGSQAERKVLYWIDPMHPAYKSDKPGKAPDCGMDLVPVYAEETAGQTAGRLPAGAFQITPEKQQLIGVEYGEAEYKFISKTLRTVGRLAYDETKMTRMHTKVEGWIEQVFVDFTGKQVSRGQPLISIYSPELWQTQQEYLLALKGRQELSESPFREAAMGSASLLQAARKRLELWDISDEQIEHLEHTGQPFKALTLYAPSDGFVLARNAFPKQRVTPETELYSIADLSAVWVIADIYEYEAPEIRLGQQAEVTLAYFPGKTFRGTVAYIYPQLDSTTRTLKVRIEVPNPGFTLKPEMYANVELKIDYGRRLVVPQEAVMDSGAEAVVFVAHEGGYFEPRQVGIGAKVGNEVIVASGLKPGERVVTSANFLIDSESKLKAAAGGMGLPGHSGNHGGAPAGAGKPSAPTDHSSHEQSVKPAAAPKTEDPRHQHEE